MLRYSSQFQNFGLLILRLGIGAAFVLIGLPKLTGGPDLWAKLGLAMGSVGVHFLPVFWGFLIAFIEFFGGVCLIAGLFTRLFGLLLALTMAVVISSYVSKGDTFNAASHAVELCVVFLCLLFTGPGKFSLDYLLLRRKD